MLFLSIVMGALTGFLTDFWLARAGVKDPTRLIVSVVVGAVVAILCDVGELAHF